MKQMNEQIKTETVTLYEERAAVLQQDSGMADAVDGQPLTNFRATEQIEAVLTGGRVFVSANGALSEKAKQWNSDISRNQTMTPAQKTAEFMVAVRVTRPIKE